jgi:phage gp36-like protein
VANVYVSNVMFFARCVAALKTADPTIVTNAGIDASGIADGFLSKRFKLPLVAPFDTGLVYNVFNLMQYQVASEIGYRPQSGQNVILDDKNTAALKWLAQVSTGLVELPLQVDSSPQVDEEGTLAMSGVKVDFAMTTGFASGCCGSCGCSPCICSGGWF